MRKLGVVALVVTGLLVISDVLPLLISGSWIPLSFSDPEQRAGLAVSLSLFALTIGLQVAFGSVLIWRRESLSRRWFDDTEDVLSISAVDLLRTGLVAVGLIIAAQAVNQLVLDGGGVLVDRILSSTMGFDAQMQLEQQLDRAVQLVADVLMLGFGVLLVVKSGSFTAKSLGARAAVEPAIESSASTCPSCGQHYNPEDYTDLSTARCTRCRSPLGGGDA